MEKVIVASKNPVKIQSVKKGFEKMFPSRKFEFVGVSVSSDVSDQPVGDDETFLGAKNRVDNAFKEYSNAKFYVGIEGGIVEIENEMALIEWIVIKSGNKYGKSKTSMFFLPQKIAGLIKEGKELGEANDIVFGKENSKQKEGAVGLLTDNVINRTDFYIDAVVLALIPFKNTDLY